MRDPLVSDVFDKLRTLAKIGGKHSNSVCVHHAEIRMIATSDIDYLVGVLSLFMYRGVRVKAKSRGRNKPNEHRNGSCENFAVIKHLA